MYDGGKIITGLAIFVGLMIFPVWYNVIGGEGHVPNPEKPVGSKHCVQSKEYMRSSHMVLLNTWRDEVIRDGKREAIVVDGVKYDKSLMTGCMKCHVSKVKFCDECHTYAAVKPYCWDCHIQPKEKN